MIVYFYETYSKVTAAKKSTIHHIRSITRQEHTGRLDRTAGSGNGNRRVVLPDRTAQKLSSGRSPWQKRMLGQKAMLDIMQAAL